MRTGIDAARFFLIETQIAGGRFSSHLRNLSSRIQKIFHLHIERMHVDIAVGTVIRTESAADAPVFNDDFKIVTAADGAYRAADHAERFSAVAARCRDEVFIPPQAIANQAADAIMSISARPDTLIASRAAVEVENQQALRFEQSLRKERVDGNVLHHLYSGAILFDALARTLS
jgi:hypothetical protein